MFPCDILWPWLKLHTAWSISTSLGRPFATDDWPPQFVYTSTPEINGKNSAAHVFVVLSPGTRTLRPHGLRSGLSTKSRPISYGPWWFTVSNHWNWFVTPHFWQPNVIYRSQCSPNLQTMVFFALFLKNSSFLSSAIASANMPFFTSIR